MRVQAIGTDGFRVRLEKNEFVSLKSASGSTIETTGKRGGYTVFGNFAAMSLKITPPNLEFMDDYTDYSIHIFVRSNNFKECKTDLTCDNNYHVHIHISSLFPDEEAQSMLFAYIKFMSYERVLKLCKIISNGKIDDTKDLFQPDLELLDYLKIPRYKQGI